MLKWVLLWNKSIVFHRSIQINKKIIKAQCWDTGGAERFSGVRTPWVCFFEWKRTGKLPFDETIDTTIEVDVDELWTITVANTPTIKPAIGLEKIEFSAKILPVILPGNKQN